MFAKVEEQFGEVTNFARVFAHRPDVFKAWAALNGAIRGNMDRRRYELATVAAARVLRSSYCSLAHAKVLRDRFYAAPELLDIVIDPERAELSPVDLEVMRFSEQVARDAASIAEEDVDRLREHGLTDLEILDVALAAAARCFFAKTLDAVGAQPDASYRTSLEPDLQEALTTGRSIAD
ncbi:MAG: peroxidase [Acidimicrobiia bacterium]|nr:peroxidase [Acidimicrobiia bacterium]